MVTTNYILGGYSNLLYEKVAKDIEERITRGEYAIGEKLPSERTLAIQFHVSRNIIREAIKLLKEKGLVKVQQGKGSYVTLQHSQIMIDNIKRMMKHNNGKLQDIVEVREVLDMNIILLAVERASFHQIERLENIVERLEKEVYFSRQFSNLDLEYHIVLAECTQNPLFLALMNSIYALLEESIHLSMIMYPKSKQDVITQHTAIVQAIKSRNKNKAKQLMKQHLALIRKEMEQIPFLLDSDRS